MFIQKITIMAYIVAGNDASPIPPDAITDVPGTMPKIGGRAGDANDGGALWWDHDDPGQPGAPGFQGLQGIPGKDGERGGDTPLGALIIIHQAINGSFPVLISGGHGQPGGQGGRGGTGGDGQDGGNADDEQPAGAGGTGGKGGKGGTGGKGGGGGNIYEVDILIGSTVDVSLVDITYTQGIQGAKGPGGPNGFPGNPGNGPGGMGGQPGDWGDWGPQDPNGIVSKAKIIVG